MVITGDEVSYLAIANNTNDTYALSVGDDETAWSIISTAGFALGIVGSVVSLGATAGVALAAIPIITRASSSLLQIAFVSTAARVVSMGRMLTAFNNTTPVQLAGATASLASFIHDNMVATGGLREIPPGVTLFFAVRFPKLVPMQATCRRVRVDPDREGQVVVDTLIMGPIYPGSAIDSSRTHDMKFWVEKNGHKDPFVVAINAAGPGQPQRDAVGGDVFSLDELPEGVVEDAQEPETQE